MVEMSFSKNIWELWYLIKKVNKYFVVIIIFLCLFHLSNVDARFAPWTHWKTVETKNFRIHYPSKLERFTSYLSLYLEEAYQILSLDLKWKVKNKIEVVVSHDSDVPNGIASVFPFNRMVVNAVPFSPISSIGEYDNWIRTLAFHELTHIVANDTSSGNLNFLRTVFGSIAKVNSYQPRWLTEGLAVFEETQQSYYGRGRSTFMDMVIRTAVKENILNSNDIFFGLTIDRLNDGPAWWTRGITPYLFGYLFYEVLIDRYGLSAPGVFSNINASRLPFFLNKSLNEAFETDFYNLWSDVVKRVSKYAKEDLKKINSSPLTDYEFLTKEGRFSGGPVLSNDQKEVYFFRDSFKKGRGISKVNLKTKSVTHLTKWSEIGKSQLKSCFIENKNQGLLYSKIHIVNGYNYFSDIFLWDVNGSTEMQVTYGKRAMDPDCSSDFLWEEGGITKGHLVYIKNMEDGNQAIVLWDGKKEKVLYQGERFERLASPAWGKGPAKDWIAFTFKVNGGNERVFAVNIKSKKVQAITRHKSPALRISEVTPHWSEKGDLLFSSSLGGVLNIYKLSWKEVQNSLQEYGVSIANSRITHLDTGAISPVTLNDSDDLIAMVYGKRGFDLAKIKSKKQTKPILELKTIQQKMRTKNKTGSNLSEDKKLLVDWPDEKSDFPKGEVKKYSVWPALLPHYWLPYFQKVPEGWLVGLSTGGMDSLEHHLYSLVLSYDNRASFPVYNLMYQYDGLYPSIRITHSQSNQYLGLLGESNRLEFSSLRFSYPISKWQVSFGGTHVVSRYQDSTSTTGGLEIAFSHKNFSLNDFAIDPDKGDKGHRVDLKLTGYLLGEKQFSSYEFFWEQRLPSFVDDHFFRSVLSVARSTNRELSSKYFVGGGISNISLLSPYLLRGYPSGVLYGRSIFTLNLEYWLPLMRIYSGRGVIPLYHYRTKMRFFLDTGTAELVSNENSAFNKWPIGVGVQFMHDTKVLFRFPLTLAIGFNFGVSSQYNKETQVVLGLISRVND